MFLCVSAGCVCVCVCVRGDKCVWLMEVNPIRASMHMTAFVKDYVTYNELLIHFFSMVFISGLT